MAMRRRLGERSVWGLAAILVLAAVLRLVGLNWDQHQHLHPDERFLTMVTETLRWPGSLSEYMDEARSPLNPRNVGFPFFAYGTLPLALVKAAGAATGAGGYDALVLVGRATSALFDLGTLVLVILLARALCADIRVARLSAMFYAVAVLPIQQAHFFVVDPPASFFTTATLLGMVRYQATGRLRDCLLGGGALGLGLACKPSIAPLALVMLIVVLARRGRGVRSWQDLLEHLGAWALLCLTAVLVFRFVEPDAFSTPAPWNILPSDRWLADVRQAAALVSGKIDIPPGVQWAGRTPLVFPWWNLVVWGLGPPLGVAASVGVGVAAWRLVAGDLRFLVPVAWTLLLFGWQGSQFSMSMRYFLPIYGCLVIFAAQWLVDRARWVAIGVVLCSGLWAIAFVGVYQRPHSRVQASEWMYVNVPRGSVLGVEHWDDALPLRTASRPPGPDVYPSVEMTWYDPDTPEKLERALGWLDRVDDIVLSSDRLLRSIPRLPARYPMTTRYYSALLDGRLGFALVAEFSSPPSLLGLRLPTESAEEAFSVYDHPRVRIFAKTPAYSRARAAQLLGDVNWDAVVRQTSRQMSDAPTGLMLPDERWNRQQRAGTWTAIVPERRRGGETWPWLATVFLLGWSAFPYLFATCSNTADRGYGLARILGVLIVTWLAWLVASLGLAPLSQRSLVGTGLVVAAGGAALAARQRGAMVAYIRSEWRLLVLVDVLFVAAFALAGWLRQMNPDLWHPYLGGEKPMDFAYLLATLKSESFPPYNPWFAGGFINYYYFGFVMVAGLIALTRTVPEVAYNLAIATWFGFSATAVFVIVYALSTAAWRPRRRALVALGGVVTVLILGNLKQIQLLLELVADASGVRHRGLGGLLSAALQGGSRCLREGCPAAAPSFHWYFSATRAYAHASGEAPPITEFPFFTFLYGDLHAHLLALPLVLLVIGLATALAARPAARAGLVALLGVSCGAVWATNTWDLPLCLVVALLALWFGRRPAQTRFGAVGTIAAVVAIAYLSFLPFHRWVAMGYTAVDWWRGSRTPLGDYLLVHGPFLLVIGASAWVSRRALRQSPHLLSSFTLALGALAWLLTLLAEGVVVHGDISRMNTVFKLTFEAWVLFGIVAAAAASWALASVRRPRAYALGLALVLTPGLVYPLTAVIARRLDRFDRTVPLTWDGMAFMETAVLNYRGHELALGPDLEAIRWLRANVTGTPTIAEWNTRPILYSWGNRISTYTGLPAIVGWDWHLRQQMASHAPERVTHRIVAVQELYDTPQPKRACQILGRYGARYVIVGGLERASARPEGIAKFAAGRPAYWDVVYDRNGVQIYRTAARCAARSR